MKTSLIIGMGIGNLYAKVLRELGHGIITVDADPAKGADFTSVDDAIAECKMFDTVHICTPNFTHFEIARKLAPVSRIVFIEKPGVASAGIWETLVKSFPSTRIMMVKNNMWRSNIDQLKLQAMRARYVDFFWCNKDRVPNPGTWFTTKSLAFGGVSRDLMPHLLSLYIAINDNWRTEKCKDKGAEQHWQLEDLTQTDYGTVKTDGIYDVDDFCFMDFGIKWNLEANWRNDTVDMRYIEFHTNDGLIERFELGLCPEEAYLNMIKDAVNNIDRDDFWSKQLEIDIWIHQQIENL
jgi:predicted dehydrogenase